MRDERVHLRDRDELVRSHRAGDSDRCAPHRNAVARARASRSIPLIARVDAVHRRECGASDSPEPLTSKPLRDVGAAESAVRSERGGKAHGELGVVGDRPNWSSSPVPRLVIRGNAGGRTPALNRSTDSASTGSSPVWRSAWYSRCLQRSHSSLYCRST